MSVERVWEKLGESGVVPVIAIDRETDALPLADALLAGGLPVVEITFRTAAAAGAIRTITMERPQLLVGAGTVLTLDNLEAAKANGAQFAVAPGCNPRVVNRARELGIPFIPGIATPTDIESALETGCRLLKFFPAEALGGTTMLDALSAPYQHTGVRFMPTGGVTPSNLENYLRVKTVVAVGGTWIAKKEDLAGGRWEEIVAKCRVAREWVARVRGRGPEQK